MGEVVNLESSKRRRKAPDRDKTALVLAGGGFTGAVYEIGALRALDLLAKNITVNDFDIVVGTSCGSFVGSLIANGCRPEDLMRSIDGEEVPGYEGFRAGDLLRPNYRGFMGSGRMLPGRAAMLAKDIMLNLHRLSLVDIVSMVAEMFPSGFYALDRMTQTLGKQLERPGYTNDFRELERELYIVATDLDTCEQVVFGEPGWDDVPISHAAAASSALPVVFKGVEMRGRTFVDGGISSVANIDVAIRHGAKLVVVVNPLVPYIQNPGEVHGVFPHDGGRRISDRGLFHVSAQTFKMLVWSGLHERLRHLQEMHPDVDFILIEPRPDDELMFMTQIMNTSQRVQIARHGFESVTVQLGANFDRYKAMCAKHGIKLTRREVITALQESSGAESGTARWRRILERKSTARSS